jgi:hypothetical protein
VVAQAASPTPATQATTIADNLNRTLQRSRQHRTPTPATPQHRFGQTTHRQSRFATRARRSLSPVVLLIDLD